MAWEIYNDNIICDNVSSEQTAIEQFLPDDPKYYAGIAEGNVILNYATVTFIHEPADADSWCHASLRYDGAVNIESLYSRSICIEVDANASTSSRTCKIYLQNSAGVKSLNYILITLNGKLDYKVRWYQILLTQDEYKDRNIFIMFIDDSTSAAMNQLIQIPSVIPIDRLKTFYTNNTLSLENNIYLSYPTLYSFASDVITNKAFDNQSIKIMLIWQKNNNNYIFDLYISNELHQSLGYNWSTYTGDTCGPTFITGTSGSLIDNNASLTQTLENLTYDLASSKILNAVIGKRKMLDGVENIAFYRYVKSPIPIDNAGTTYNTATSFILQGTNYYENI